METLYARLLGDRYAELHPLLQRFHSSPHGGTCLGRLRVTHAPGRLPWLLTRMLRLPRPAESVEVRLEVTPIGQGERWSRSFAGSPFVTFQKVGNGLLLERAGLGWFALAVEVVNGGMVFSTRRAWLAILPLPLRLAPSVRATVVPTETGWEIAVTMKFPLVGDLIEYRGEMIPQWT